MPPPAPDRINIPRTFWAWIQKCGLQPVTILHQAHLPLVHYENAPFSLTTSQLFALWRSIGECYPDPAFGLNFGAQVDFASFPISTLAAYHARDYRDSLARQMRFNQFCSPVDMRIEERKDECVVETKWRYAVEDAPPLLTDAGMAILLELGRRGTQYPLHPKRIELKNRPRTTAHKAYFNCPVDFRARRNAVVLRAEDLDRPFVTYNADLLEMIQTQLELRSAGYRTETTTSEQVKWILKQMLAGGRPEIEHVARELGSSVRTLQRRIVQEKTTFRDLLLAVRQELVREYLGRPGMQINEVAFLLGYEDTNSFYRAFRGWEGTTPAHWRTDRHHAQASAP